MSRLSTTCGVGGSRTTWPLLLLASLAMGLPPCASTVAAAPEAPRSENPLVLFHWWSSPSELAALDALSAVVKARHPGFTERRTAAPPDRGAGLFALLHSLSKAGKPPDVMTMNTGYPLKPFVDAGLLARLDDLWISERLEKVVSPGLQAVNSFDGHYYSAPIDIHRSNLIWYNKKLLDRHGIDPATLTTWDRFFEAAEHLRAGGVATPIQMAATWTTVEVFGGMVASQGLPAYQAWVNGRISAPNDPSLVEALGTLKRYAGFANRDHAGLDWPAALRRVATGQAAFCFMGDWAHGEFRAAGLVFGKDYGVIVAPGTNGLYVTAVDAFVKPLGLARSENANRWLRVAASREGQDAFNTRKGSIPARRDVNPARYDDYQRWAIASFRQSTPLPVADAAMPPTYVNAVSGTLEAFLANGNVRQAAAALAAATASSSFSRVWSPQ